MGCNQHPFPLLDLGNYFFIPKGQGSGNSVLQTLTGGELIFSEVCVPAILNDNKPNPRSSVGSSCICSAHSSPAKGSE